MGVRHKRHNKEETGGSRSSVGRKWVRQEVFTGKNGLSVNFLVRKGFFVVGGLKDNLF